MSSPFRFRALRSDEAADAARRAALSFGPPDDFEALVERYRARAGDGLIWVLADATTDVVYAQALLTQQGHWFGGRAVPCQHIGGVGVSPEHRGGGVASTLMAEAVAHGSHEGSGLSLLFPATTRLYRGLGWEHAGAYTRWRIAARDVPAAGPALRPLDDEWDAVRACQARWAAGLNGPEVRDDRRWERIREAATYAYGLDAADGTGLEAYVLVAQERIADDWRYRMRFVDWAAETPRGLQAVVGFVGRHGTIGHEATFVASTPNPWTMFLPEQDLARINDFDWMARGLDLPAAVAARGFNEAVTASVTLQVDDPLLPAAVGPWRLEVAGGSGVLEPAHSAEVRLDATAVGPMFTGYRSPTALAAAGRAVGPVSALRALDAVFAGPPPTLLDFF